MITIYIIGKLNSALYFYKNEQKKYTVEAINDFINILNS